jgi:hypothetical protein
MKPSRTLVPFLLLAGLCLVEGCKHHEITAVPLSRWNCDEPEGIPFYLPKPLLIISKNFRNIEESKVGLTNSAPIPNYFDDQARYADLNSRSTFQRMTSDSGNTTIGGSTSTTTITAPAGTATASAPVLHSGAVPVTPSTVASDGIGPETFYTYQIVFVPDLSQKYGLKIKGGVGEIRAAMNLVNGWQFTGLGPYYMKDSSSAQNILAGGIGANLTLAGAADVLKELRSLREAAAGAGGKGLAPGATKRTLDTETVTKILQPLKGMERITFQNFAEIYIYEQVVQPDGRTSWQPIANHTFYREMLGCHKTVTDSKKNVEEKAPPPKQEKTLEPPPKPGNKEGSRGLERAVSDVVPGIGHVTLQNNNYAVPQAAQPKPAPTPTAKNRGHSFFDLFHKRRPQIRTIQIDERKLPGSESATPAGTQDPNAPQFGVTPQSNEPE